jgi:hypothetical protein
MSCGVEIVVSSPVKGMYTECTVVGTPYPGTFMTLVPATAPVGGYSPNNAPVSGVGRFSWQTYAPYGGVDGQKNTLTAVLINDYNQGMLNTTQYSNGQRGLLYFPLPGDQYNAIVQQVPVSGTADNHVIGDSMKIQFGTGWLLRDPTLAGGKDVFQLLETINAIAVATLMWGQAI